MKMMDLEEKNTNTEISVFRQSLSMDRVSSSSGGGRSSRRSFSYVFHPPRHQIDDDHSDSDSVSEAGDIGDRALRRNSIGANGSSSSRFRLSLDHIIGETSVIVPISDVSPGNTLDTTEQSLQDDVEEEDHWLLKYLSCLALLALFGIVGVISRYYLQKLFGPEVIGATSERNYMYLDLPSNMVGSFLMGWLGVVFKADISTISDNLAIGLTTGFLGSLTTFSGWNQKMLDLSVEGHWVFSVLGILIGLLLAASSIAFGIETAKGIKWLWNRRPNTTKPNSPYAWKLDKNKVNLIVTIALVLILFGVWAVFSTREATEFKKANDNAQLLFACIVGPFGVWMRWYFARLNGRGIGENGQLKWVPFGTLAANVLAASLMAALSILKKAVKTEACNTVTTGLQIGFLGCLSTVSTFIAEFDAMRRSRYPWRGYAYAFSTIFISFALGTLIYSLPVWVKGYD